VPPIDDWVRKVFQSSHLHSGKFSPSRREMVLYFGPDKTEYSGQATQRQWDDLTKAQSPGAHVRNILGKQINLRRKDK
jgi:hypothetical protein